MLYPVELGELARVWDVVTPYLNRAFERSAIPIKNESVYKALESDSMRLFLMVYDSKVQGALVVHTYYQLDIQVLNVFAISHDEGYPDVKQDSDELVKLAKVLGCEYLIGHCRLGFTKTAPAWGFKHSQALMARKVN